MLNLLNLINHKPQYKNISGGAVIIGTITFNKTEKDDMRITKNFEYTIFRHNNGLYTLTNNLSENVVISKGSLRFNQYYKSIIKSY